MTLFCTEIQDPERGELSNISLERDYGRFGIIHFAFGLFRDPWEIRRSLKNGTEAEIIQLTKNEIYYENITVNHLIVTFDNVESVTIDLLDFVEENPSKIFRLRIPDNYFKIAKNKLIYRQPIELLSYQVEGALDHLSILPNAIFHFHSWECGFLVENTRFKKKYLNNRKTLFSPYLTVLRLSELIKRDIHQYYTLRRELLPVATYYELILIKQCQKTILESNLDFAYYTQKIEGNYQLVSFLEEKSISYMPRKPRNNVILCIAGGRAVYEKGFIQLIKRFAELAKWGEERDYQFILNIYCIDYEKTRESYCEFIYELSNEIRNQDMQKIIRLLPRTSISEFKELTNAANVLLVPSLFDSFCLMPTFAFASKTAVLISTYTGISDYVESKEYLFDPLLKNSLIKPIEAWLNTDGEFTYKNINPLYTNIYSNL